MPFLDKTGLAHLWSHIVARLNDKADKTHTHAIADVSDLQSSLDAKVPTSRTINGKALTTDISLTASDVGALPGSTVIPSIDGLATEEYVNTQVSTKPGKFGTGSKAEIFNVDINKATGNYSHAEGYATTASGDNSHAEGYLTTAFGSHSHAEGFATTASGNNSHAEGSSYSDIIDLTGEANTTEYVYSNTTEYKNNDYFVVNGSIVFVTNVDATNKIITVSNTLSAEAITNKRYTIHRGIAIGNYSHAEGYATTASGHYSHAESYRTTASGEDSHAEGSNTTASGNYSHAEGWGADASGRGSHAEGNRTTASGEFSHAEGSYTTASGTRSHAEGWGADASGDQSHAEGNYTVASGRGSHAEGGYTEAYGDYQHVQGKHNLTRTLEDANNYANIVGAGTASNDRKDIHTLDWNGNAWFAGDVYVGSTSGKDKDAGSKKLVTESDLSTAIAKKSQVQIITWEADD